MSNRTARRMHACIDSQMAAATAGGSCVRDASHAKQQEVLCSSVKQVWGTTPWKRNKRNEVVLKTFGLEITRKSCSCKLLTLHIST